MQSKSLKVFFASFTGAGIGGLIALQFTHNVWLAMIGLLIGGLIGYIGYDWKQAKRAISTAYTWTSSQEGREDTKYFFWGVMCSSMSLLDLFLIVKYLPERFSAFGVFLVLAVHAYLSWVTHNEESAQDNIKELRKVCLGIFLPVLIIYHLPRGIVWYAKNIYERRQQVYSFFWKAFVLMHSEERLICGVDALIGAAIGFFVGSALIGALAGGVLGVINYKLVTEKWLKPKGYLPIGT